MGKVIAQFAHGHVYTKTVRIKDDQGKISMQSQPVIRVSPAKQAKLLMAAHTPVGALGLIDGLGPNNDKFWVAVRQMVVSQLNKDAAAKGK